VKLSNWMMTVGVAGLFALAGCDSDETDDGTGGSASGTGGGGGTTSGTGGTTSSTSTSGGGDGGMGGSTSSGGGDGGMGGGVGGMAGGGGMGGSGGQGCTEPVAGPPTVTSATTVTLTPDMSGGVYTLVFSEAVNNVSTSLTWAGAGTMDGVTVVDTQTYDVAFSGLAPSDTATLTVAVTVDDTCGNVLAAPVVINVGVLAACNHMAEGFETWPPTNWTVVNNAPGAWTQETATVHPTGGSPTEGTNLARFNSWTASSGSTAALESPSLNLSGLVNGVLRFDMYHDDSFSGTPDDQLEVEYDTGGGWTAIGPVFLRYGDSDAWTTHEVDMSSLAGQAATQLRFLATSDYGNDVYIDNVCFEEFTPLTCPCPSGGFAETLDTNGTSDGNGTLGTAETTGGVLTNAADAVSVCGLLEDDTTSGTDYFLFDTAGAATDLYAVTVDYCLEEMFTDGIIEIRDGSDVVLASVPAAAGSGSLQVNLPGLASYYVVLSEGVTAYPGSTYSVTVTADAVLSTMWSEGFETWPPTNLTVVNGTGNWAQAPGTVHPSGAVPTEGNNLAYFDSWSQSSGSTATLESAAQNFTNVTTAVLYFDMYHDTGFSSSLDRVQVEYDTGGGWTAIGPEFMRYVGWSGWGTTEVDLSSLAGQASVQIRFLATSGYGNDVHIDNALIYSN